jgi:hypothetical protein
MGCASSNQHDSNEGKKAANGNATNEGGGDDATPKQNPYTTLTHREIFRMRMSWKAVKRSMEETGLAMFVR